MENKEREELEMNYILKNLAGRKNVKKVLFLLQNAWGDKPLPIMFRPNEFNKSAKTCRKIIGERTIMFFANTTPVVTLTAKGKAIIDKEHVEKVLSKTYLFDLLIIAGKQSEEAYQTSKIKTERYWLMPHPASRNLTNALLKDMKDYFDKGIGGNFSFEQFKGHHIIYPL